MKILTADYILTCDEDFTIIKDGAICFNEKIVQIGHKDEVIEKNPYAIVKKLSPNSVIMPGLVNTHVHLEYSSNRTSLEYGDFIKWLNSVVKKRDVLRESCDKSCYEDALYSMLESGVLCLGAISSFGEDLFACYETPQKVVYFNEILGSNPDFVDEICRNFEIRLQKSFDIACDSLIPAVSIHSPYSTHPMIARYAIDEATKNDMTVSTHFMESRAEREWLDSGSGEFKRFLSSFVDNPKPMYLAMEYLSMFEGCDAIFAHCNLATDEELEYISKIGSISHCFVSNRILNNPIVDFKKIEKQNILMSIGTDGLSSNMSLNMWDEMRATLFANREYDILKLSKKLLRDASINGAKALKLKENDEFSSGKSADLITVVLPDKVEDVEQLALELILHTKEAKSAYIDGERCV